MRAAWYVRKGPALDVLQVGELPNPTPAAGEVLVRIKASGINPSDTKGRGGARGNSAMPFPRIVPHMDGAGVIEAVGPGVAESRFGERVWVYEAQLGRAFGTAAEYIALPAANAVPMPDGLSFEEGACLGVPALTAHRCVFGDGKVDGQTILVTGGAGAVGFYAIQFAKIGGARVMTTVSTREQAELARGAGADLVVNRREEDIVQRATAFTGTERGVDRIVEVAFGANLDASLELLAPSGTIAAYSSDAAPEPTVPFWQLLTLNAAVRFVMVYAMGLNAHREAISATSDAINAGRLVHNVGTILPLDSIAKAHELVERGEGGGKVIVQV